MEIESLQAKLESHFELSELVELARDALGFEPEAVGGNAALGSFVPALVRYCLANDALDALGEAVRAHRANLSQVVDQLLLSGVELPDELPSGTRLGDVEIVRSLGQGRVGRSYFGRYGAQPVRVKVLHQESVRDRRGLNRFATVVRLASQVQHPWLATGSMLASVDGQILLLSDFFEGESLAARLARSGPVHINEARPIMTGVLEALSALHGHRIIHGGVRLENVIVSRNAQGETHGRLLDAGSDRLIVRSRPTNDLLGDTATAKILAPEVIGHAAPASVASDLYALGILVYELLTGRSPFGGNALEIAFGHINQTPPIPSTLAPRGWISHALDEFVMVLLAKQPSSRPPTASSTLARLQTVEMYPTARPPAAIDDDELAQRLESLVFDPESTQAAVALDLAIDDGADPERVADAFRMAALDIPIDGTPTQRFTRKNLLVRAARLFDEAIQDAEKAEQCYAWAAELDADDESIRTALERLRRRLGKFEDVIEMLLERGQNAATRVDRGRAFAEIGKIYMSELGELDQALVAYTQALCEDVGHLQYAVEIERLAGSNLDSWAEVLEACNEPLEDNSLSPQEKVPFLIQVGRWYAEKASRPDMALPCLQSAIASEPQNEEALSAMAQVYRKTQKWSELGMVLSRWTESTRVPAKARDLRTEAAELAEHQLNDLASARAMYEGVLADDPTHARASDGLARVCERSGDWAGYIKVLQARASALRGNEHIAMLLRIAETYEDRLSQDSEAIRIVEGILGDTPEHFDALRALDRLYAKVGRFNDLIDVLERQVRVATTPRQKTQIFERIASVYEEEFLDHDRATAALRAVLALDPNHDAALTSLIRNYRALDQWEQVAELTERHLEMVEDPARKVALGLQLGRVLAEQLAAPDRAMKAFEDVLSFEPQNTEALEMVARLRESLGDADTALAAIDMLAAKATNPQSKAEQYLRAARLLQSRGSLDQAISHFKLALDAVPDHPAATVGLRESYLERGDAHAAIQVLEQEINRTQGERAKAKLLGELASIAQKRLYDDSRAEEAARAALALDPTNAQALSVLGDIAYAAKRFVEAAKHYSPLIDRVESLSLDDAATILVRACEVLTHTDSPDRAHATFDELRKVAPQDVDAQVKIGKILFEKGDPARTALLHAELLRVFGDELDSDLRAQTAYRLGESLRRAGKPDAALEALEEACDLDPSNGQPLKALDEAYSALERWHDAIKTKFRRLDIAIGDERVQLLIEIGDITADKFGDRRRAIQSLVAALEDRPDDRRLLTKLMQLYSDEKDWNRLVDVVLKLASFVDEPKQKAKYLHTAAIVTARQMGDVESALEIFEQVLELDPTIVKAFAEAVELHRSRGDFASVERLLRRRLELAQAADDTAAQVETYTALATLYERDLGWIDYAIDALEHAEQLDPDSTARTLKITTLAASDPGRFINAAATAHLRLLAVNPTRVESYRAMRRLYTEAKSADGAWCLCQALAVLGMADADEQRFYKRMRTETAAPAQAIFGEYEWSLVTHPDVDPLLTNLFAIIEPAITLARMPDLRELGYEPSRALDLSQTPAPMAQTLYYAAGVLGLEAPPCFVISDDPGGLSFLQARTPGIGLGRVAMSSQVPPQAAAFIAARHLSYMRPGYFLRQLLTSATGLKSWLFASIKLISPQFPVSPDIEGAVREAQAALDKGLRGTARDELATVVSSFLREGAALDLKKWVSAVDLSADRVGLVIAHDLDTAAQLIRASDESTSAVPGDERLRRLALFAVSPEYLQLRQRLSIAVDS